MDRPRFNIRAMLLSVTLFAISIGSLRAALDSRFHTSLGVALWIVGGACISAGLGVLFNKGLRWSVLGAIAAVLSFCLSPL